MWSVDVYKRTEGVQWNAARTDSEGAPERFTFELNSERSR
jgi:hypothetical protein